MTSTVLGQPRTLAAPSLGTPAARPERERLERARFVARVVEHVRDGLELRTAVRPGQRLELERGRTTFTGTLDPPGRSRGPALASLLLLVGLALLALQAGPWPWLAVRVAGWIAIASSPVALVVLAGLRRRSRRPVVVLVDARRRRLRRDVLMEHWEQACRAHARPVTLWAFARGGMEHAALEAAADLPVRCFVATRGSFVELHLPGR